MEQVRFKKKETSRFCF